MNLVPRLRQRLGRCWFCWSRGDFLQTNGLTLCGRHDAEFVIRAAHFPTGPYLAPMVTSSRPLRPAHPKPLIILCSVCRINNVTVGTDACLPCRTRVRTSPFCEHARHEGCIDATCCCACHAAVPA